MAPAVNLAQLMVGMDRVKNCEVRQTVRGLILVTTPSHVRRQFGSKGQSTIGPQLHRTSRVSEVQSSLSMRNIRISIRTSLAFAASRNI